MDGGADAASVGDLVAVGAGPLADLGELVFVGAASGGAAGAGAAAAGGAGGGGVGLEGFDQLVEVLSWLPFER